MSLLGKTLKFLNSLSDFLHATILLLAVLLIKKNWTTSIIYFIPSSTLKLLEASK